MSRKNKLVSVIIVTRNRKKDLIDCVQSLIDSKYSPIEIIVIDNASDKPLKTWFVKKFPRVILYSSKENLGAAQGRNEGIKLAKGEFLLFMDDDGVADKKMISELVKTLELKKKFGIAQPKIYDKDIDNLLQGAGHEINLLTGRITGWGVREFDEGQYDLLREIPLAGCIWMAKRSVINKIGGYDTDYFIPFEDSDFSYRASKAGFKILCIPSSKAWHQGRKVTFVHPALEWLGITSVERAYRVSRNKLIYMRKHAPFPKNILYFFTILPVYIILQCIIILSSGRMDVFRNYLLGLMDGMRYVMTHKSKNEVYQKIS